MLYLPQFLFTESALRPIQSINCNVRLSVCLCVVCAIGRDPEPHGLETSGCYRTIYIFSSFFNFLLKNTMSYSSAYTPFMLVIEILYITSFYNGRIQLISLKIFSNIWCIIDDGTLNLSTVNGLFLSAYRVDDSKYGLWLYTKMDQFCLMTIIWRIDVNRVALRYPLKLWYY